MPLDLPLVAAVLILLLVLVLPLISHRVERNLEAFLFVMGLIVALSAGSLSRSLVRDALTHPVPITLAVLVAGFLFRWTRPYVGRVVVRMRLVIPLRLMAGVLVTLLALLSSVITVIIASLVLVELISVFGLSREDESRFVVIACMAMGLGAALTPIGEPLSTIATAKLEAEFWFLFRLLGPWIVPGILALGAWVTFQPLRYSQGTLSELPHEETVLAVVGRAARVYLFVMALTLLGEGFKPVIDRFIVALDARVLYWTNMVSAIVDNATLTAAEVSPRMEPLQVRAVLMGLLISGGMLIPGNIPNIITANKLGIRSRTWARVGVPLGLGLMAVYFFALFLV